MMFRRILALLGIISAVAVLCIINLTTPSTNGAAIVLVFFIVFYMMLVSGLTFFIYWINLIIEKVFYSDKVRPVDALSFRRSYYYASIFALAPVILISMKSVGKSGILEWLLVIFFLVIGYIYVSRQTK